MDPQPPERDTRPGDHIASLINEFFDRRKAGEDLTREGFIAEHPEAADELHRHLADLSLYEKAYALGSEALTGGGSGDADMLPLVEGYNLIEEIGRGGMGVVYKARQVDTKRIVALKVMLASAFASSSARRRFDREVELAARLEHPNIVQVLESGEAAGQRYYAMSFVAGVRLDRYLAAEPDVRTTLSIFVHICEAVEHAHAHGVIHRDLKPANVLIDEQGNPRILDFGLAKATDEIGTEDMLTAYVSLPGQVVGTLFYLSPEQAAGTPEEIDARTDVYSLGVVLFESLTGSLPFDTTGRPSEVIRRILEAQPTLPRSLSGRVNSELETIILKALQKEKGRRYQSAKEMGEDIRRYLEGEPILARRPSSFYVLRKKLRKHRMAAGLGTVGLIALLAVVVGVVVESRSRRRDLADARREALHVLQGLEGQTPGDFYAAAAALLERRPYLPEDELVYAQAVGRRSGQEYMAITCLERPVKRKPPDWARCALLAEFYAAAGDMERASALRRRAEREAPDTAEAWYLRSFATLDLHTALGCAEEAAQRDPSHTLAWARLTQLRLNTGDPEGAIRGADVLVGLGERKNDWIIFKGHLLVRQGRFRDAIRAYAEAGQLGYRHQAHAYRRLKEYDKAAECYDKLMEADSERTGAVWDFYQRATPLWILGRAEEALDDYRQVRRRLGYAFYSDARSYLILRELGREQEAAKVLDAALGDVRDDWLRQIFRCLADQLSPDELVADAIARDNLEQLCEAYYYAGEVRLLAGHRDQARNCFEQCVQTGVQFDPDTSMATPMNEFELAQWRLDTLFDQAPPASTPQKASRKN